MVHTAAPTWFITGASSGIGLALTRAAAGRGDHVIALARRTRPLDPIVLEHSGRVVAIPADVRRRDEVDAAVERGLEAFGRIDLVANNAGYGLFGAVEEASDEQARQIFDTNVFGVLNVLRATLPVLRSQGSGHIFQGSSFYGRTGHAGVGLLCATKYAVEGMTEALVAEVRPLGIEVTLVEPGPTATPFGANFDQAATIADYDGTVRVVARETAALPADAYDSPDGVARAILGAADAPEPPLRLITGSNGLALVKGSLDAQLAELEEWSALSRTADTLVAR
jgi:NAD(P)-dependent dehydrogenase (short-subunit alcohol dehydrogenase family)